MITSSNSLSRGSGMPNQVDGAFVRAMSGTELSRVRTEFRPRPPRTYQLKPLESRAAEIVMQSSSVLVRQMSGYPTNQDFGTSASSASTQIQVTLSKFFSDARRTKFSTRTGGIGVWSVPARITLFTGLDVEAGE